MPSGLDPSKSAAANENTTTTATPATAGQPPPSPPAAPRRKSSFRWLWLVVLAVLAVVAYLIYQQHQAARAQKVKAAPPARGVPVTATAARKGDIGVYISALGTVIPVYTVTVTSRVAGQIMNIYYREGQLVHKGDPLLEIDPRPYEAQLTQAEGQLAHDQAALNKDRIDLERYQAASARNAIAKQQVDDQQQLVHQDEGTVKNDQGTVENARLNIIYCHITSPIEGRAGLRLVDPGNIVQANSTTPLVVITQLQPITVVFSVAEDYLPQIQQQFRQGHRLPVEAFDRAQQTKIASGELLTVDNQIDVTTGTVKLKATFQNKDQSLFPNQFVNARLLVDTQRGVTLVPGPAIQRSATGAFVFVIRPDETAAIRNVTVGVSDGNISAVQGVEPDEIVATNGFDKLQDGVKVSIQSTGGAGQAPNATTPANPPAPTAAPNASRGARGRPSR